MSSDSNGHKPDSVEPGPASGPATRLSARAPSVWGPVRDALAALHNLAALLKSGSVRYKVILDLLPELRAGAAVLSDAFERALASADEASREVGEQGRRSVGELVQLLDATAGGDEERDDLAARAKERADDLDASAEMLALLEGAADPVPTSVSVRVIVRETGRLGGGGHRREITVLFDAAAADVTIDVDPRVVGPLLSLLLAIVRAAGAGDVVVRTSEADEHAVIVIEPAGPSDAAHRPIAVRVLPALPPAEKAARRAASLIGASLELSGPRAVLRLPRAPG